MRDCWMEGQVASLPSLNKQLQQLLEPAVKSNRPLIVIMIRTHDNMNISPTVKFAITYGKNGDTLKSNKARDTSAE